MTKKIKLKDLEEDNELVDFIVQEKTGLDKISLDDFVSDEPENLFNEDLPNDLPTVPVKKKIIKTKKVKAQIEDGVKVVEKKEVDIRRLKKYVVKRSILKTFLSKLLSFVLILGAIELANHVMRYFDEVNILDISNFQSVLISDDMSMNIVKGILFLLFVYFITPKENIIINKAGIYCTNTSIVSSYFLVLNSVFVSWNKIEEAHFQFKLFEPYVILYGVDENIIGRFNFNLENNDSFFELIGRYVSQDHPLMKLKTEVRSF